MGKANFKWEELESKIEKEQKKLYSSQDEEEIRKKANKEPKENKKTEKVKEKITLPIIIAVIFLLFVFFSIIFALMNIDNNNIISGVKIEGIDVSGLSREEAKSYLN